MFRLGVACPVLFVEWSSSSSVSVLLFFCIGLKCDTFLVIICPFFFRAVTRELYGTSLMLGVSLFCLCCLTRTQSPALISLFFAFLLFPSLLVSIDYVVVV